MQPSIAPLHNTIDWSLARSFLAVLDAGSLLGAARVLGTSQPTVGRHIAALEAQSGVALFERTGRGLRPTAAALQLQEAARAMEAGALQWQRQLSGASTAQAGAVRISASQPVACALLPPVLARLRAALPEVQIELLASNAVSNLLRREADIALRMVRPTQASLVARRIAGVTLGAYAHRSYLRQRGVPQQPADLLGHALVGNDADDTLLRAFAAHGTPVGREAFDVRTDDLMAYWACVRAGLGVGFVADYLAASDTQVQRVLPGLRLPVLPVWLTVHREIRGSRRIRAVFDLLAREVPAQLAAMTARVAAPSPA